MLSGAAARRSTPEPPAQTLTKHLTFNILRCRGTSARVCYPAPASQDNKLLSQDPPAAGRLSGDLAQCLTPGLDAGRIREVAGQQEFEAESSERRTVCSPAPGRWITFLETSNISKTVVRPVGTSE